MRGICEGEPSHQLDPRDGTPRELDGLPEPVQRYFRAVLKDGQRIVGAATVEHAGTFNLSPAGEQWRPFTSEQRVVTRHPGFVWNGHIALLPALPGLAVHASTTPTSRASAS